MLPYYRSSCQPLSRSVKSLEQSTLYGLYDRLFLLLLIKKNPTDSLLSGFFIIYNAQRHVWYIYFVLHFQVISGPVKSLRTSHSLVLSLSYLSTPSLLLIHIFVSIFSHHMKYSSENTLLSVLISLLTCFKSSIPAILLLNANEFCLCMVDALPCIHNFQKHS